MLLGTLGLALVFGCSDSDQARTADGSGRDTATTRVDRSSSPDYEFLRRIADNLGTIADLALAASGGDGPASERYHTLHEERSGQRADATGLIRTVFDVEYVAPGPRQNPSGPSSPRAIEAEHRAGLEIIDGFSARLEHPEVRAFADRLRRAYAGSTASGP